MKTFLPLLFALALVFYSCPAFANVTAKQAVDCGGNIVGSTCAFTGAPATADTVGVFSVANTSAISQGLWTDSNSVTLSLIAGADSAGSSPFLYTAWYPVPGTPTKTYTNGGSGGQVYSGMLDLSASYLAAASSTGAATSSLTTPALPFSLTAGQLIVCVGGGLTIGSLSLSSNAGSLTTFLNDDSDGAVAGYYAATGTTSAPTCTVSSSGGAMAVAVYIFAATSPGGASSMAPGWIGAPLFEEILREVAA